jgi:hypothetical protein
LEHAGTVEQPTALYFGAPRSPFFSVSGGLLLSPLACSERLPNVGEARFAIKAER